VRGDSDGADKLVDSLVYGSVMAMTLQGTDFIAASEFHIQMVLNSEVPFHTDLRSNAPISQWSLSSVALHELCHGLFMSGQVTTSKSERMASFNPAAPLPGRFDAFLAISSGAGVAAACTNKSDFYNAVTSSALRFKDPASSGTNFGLYSPADFAKGSSVYHFDAQTLASDCAANGIPTGDCSDIMTSALSNGYTQRSIGEPTLRVMRALLGKSSGMGSGGNCSSSAGGVTRSSNSFDLLGPFVVQQ
jgi:hypothetical protein